MKQIPFYKQETKYTCGAASAKMILAKLGIKKSEKQIARILKTSKVSGTNRNYFPLLAEKYKLNYIVKRNSTISTLKKYKRKNYLIIINYYDAIGKFGHYAVVSKIDEEYIYLLDPIFGPEHRINLDYFNKIWKSTPNKKNSEEKWFFGIKNYAQ